MKLKSKMMLVGAAAAFVASVYADPLNLNGVDTNITDVAELAGYDGVTNSSETLATLTFDVASDMAYAGTISGNIKVAKKGVGMLTLSGDNTYTGGTVIGEYDGSTYTVGGRLRANSVSAFGATTGAITVNSDCQQSSMTSNKVTCVVFNEVGDFAYPINTSAWTTPANGPTGSAGQRQYNVAVTVTGVKLSGKITGGGLSVHCGGLSWNGNAEDLGSKAITTISGDIDCPNGTCHFGSRGTTITVTGKVTALGVYQTTTNQWPPTWSLSNTGNDIGVIDVGGGASGDYSLTASAANALGGATIYSRNAINRSYSVKISRDQMVESFSMNPLGTYTGGSLATSASRHYIQATAAATVTMLGTNNRTNDWFLKDGGASKAMSLVWNPTGDYTYTCVGHANTINGTITVSGGTFEVGDSCSFSNVTAIAVAGGASFVNESMVESSLKSVTSLMLGASASLSLSNNPFASSVTIEAEQGATLNLAADITATTVKVGDHYLSAKDFSAGTYKGLTITGAGKLYVTTRPGGEDTYTWIGGGADDNITTTANWRDSAAPDFDDEAPFIVFAGGTAAVLDRDISASGVTFYGVTAFNLSASGNSILSLGAGGISNAPAASASAVTVSAPVMPMIDQIWQMDTNVTFTLSGILKKYGTSAPTITVRQSSTADPTITFIGSSTPEGASDFAGDIVFARNDISADPVRFGTAYVRASGYEPFGPSGTLTIESAGALANPEDDAAETGERGRYACLFLTNAVISKAISIPTAYGAVIAADSLSTNELKGALTLSGDTSHPHFKVGPDSLLAVDASYSKTAGAGVEFMQFYCKASDNSGSGRIVFRGKLTLGNLKVKNPMTIELNAVSNSIDKIVDARLTNFSKPITIVCGGENAFHNGSCVISFSYSQNNFRYANFDLNGHDQYIGTPESGTPGAAFVSSDGEAVLRVNCTANRNFRGTVATNVVLQKEGDSTLTFSHATAFKAGSTLAVSNGTVAVSNVTALNEDVTLKLLGGTISIPEGQTALVGETFYLDANGDLKPLQRGTYGPGDSKIGSFFASGSGSIRVKKGPGLGFVLIYR